MGSPLFDDQLLPLAVLLDGRRLCVLTGAGISTESGIPDYRGPGTRARARQPMRFHEFVGEPLARRRYWARAGVGYRGVRNAAPNAGHLALARLQLAGRLTGLITQNVDGLHTAAGSEDVIELHGRLADVVCLDCGRVEPRPEVQARIEAQNPAWAEDAAGPGVRFAPDGDADVDAAALASFREPRCTVCAGPLKPDVVFFGEDVPRPRVHAAMDRLGEADALLVVGSSLAVFSGYRFVRQARKIGRPVVILTLGETRGDGEATLKVEGRIGEVLPRLTAALLGEPAAALA